MTLVGLDPSLVRDLAKSMRSASDEADAIGGTALGGPALGLGLLGVAAFVADFVFGGRTARTAKEIEERERLNVTSSAIGVTTLTITASPTLAILETPSTPTTRPTPAATAFSRGTGHTTVPESRRSCISEGLSASTDAKTSSVC